ncbi:MAG: CHAP domain-containing protein, partial [Acidimicrobiales bacterium]
GMATTPTGQGYWLVASDGGIFTFGDAPFYGSMGGQPINASVMGMAATPNGEGYWLVGNDGGVFTFGDAPFYGSDGAMLPNAVISGIMAAPNGAGYWLVSPDSATYGFTPTSDERILPASAGVAAAAASQIGPATAGGFCNPYGPCEEWCAYFASWTWNQAGVPSVSDGFTGDLYEWAATQTSVLGPTAMPAEGDIVFYGTGPQNTGTSIHAGVVMQTWPDGSLVTIEGDSGPGPAGWLGVTINGPYLEARSVESNGEPIYGFGEP